MYNLSDVYPPRDANRNMNIPIIPYISVTPYSAVFKGVYIRICPFVIYAHVVTLSLSRRMLDSVTFESAVQSQNAAYCALAVAMVSPCQQLENIERWEHLDQDVVFGFARSNSGGTSVVCWKVVKTSRYHLFIRQVCDFARWATHNLLFISNGDSSLYPI